MKEEGRKKKDEEREIEEREAAYHLVRSAFAFLPSVFNSRLLPSSLLPSSSSSLLAYPPTSDNSTVEKFLRSTFYLSRDLLFFSLFYCSFASRRTHCIVTVTRERGNEKERKKNNKKKKRKSTHRKGDRYTDVSRFERGFTRIRISVNVATFLARRFFQESYSFISVRSFNPSIVFDFRR